MNSEIPSGTPLAVALIQARMNSTRLPGKAMLDLGGRPLICHVIDRARAIEGVSTVVLATAHGEENAPLVELARQCGIEVFVGSLDNVLERFYLASREFPARYIIRITGDNPFTDHEYASRALALAEKSGADLTSFSGLPLGAAVEIIKTGALQRAYRESSQAYHFEHVTPYIKEHEELFRIERHNARKGSAAGLRLTVDTAEDYRLACAIYEGLYRGSPFTLDAVIDFLAAHPDLARINSAVQQRPMTHSSGN
jgi:spore coat polysaccharide biosynthesis protein SpsF